MGDIMQRFSVGRTTALKVRAAVEGYRIADGVAKDDPLNIMVIGDAHAQPDEDMSRFRLFGRAIDALRPDVVVCIGDWADMPSLSSYDRGKKGFEGRRYRKDIDAANEAKDLMEAEIHYEPRKVLTLGNHPQRILRVGECQPEMDGVLSLNDLDIYREWEAYDFLVPVEIRGVLFAHYFTSGIMGRAIASVNKGRALCLKTMQSTVSGHSHEFHHAVAYRADGSRMHGLDVGCSFDTHHEWAGTANAKYWRGLTMLHDVQDGEMDVEQWSFRRLKRRYA